MNKQIKVKVRYLLHLYTFVGNKREEEITIEEPNPTIRNVIDKLIKKYGEEFKKMIIDPKTNDIRYYPSIEEKQKAHRVLLNGVNIQLLKGINTELKDGDTLSIY
ncbi:MAG: MoaD/ThiS family protein [Candidatus Bathyarchaeia archaeon]